MVRGGVTYRIVSDHLGRSILEKVTASEPGASPGEMCAVETDFVAFRSWSSNLLSRQQTVSADGAGPLPGGRSDGIA